MISGKFIKSSFVYIIAGALPLASSLILLPFYTHYLSISQFGELAIYIAFTLLFQTLINLGMDFSVGITFYDFKNDEVRLKKMIGSVICLLLLSGLFFSVLSIFTGEFIFNFIFKAKQINFYPFGFLSVITAVFNNIFKNYTVLLVHQRRLSRYIFVNVVNFAATIAITLVGLYLFPNTLIGPIWGRFLSGLVIFTMALIFMLSEFKIHFDRELIKKMFQIGLPLFIYLILAWVVSYVDRYVINYYMDTSVVGIYDLAMKCVILMEFISNGIETSINPVIFSKWANEKNQDTDKEINKYFNAYSAITILLCAFFIFILPLVIPLFLFRPEYKIAIKYIPLLLLSYLFRPWYNFYVAPMQFFKKTILLPKVFFFSTCIQVAVSVYSIKYFGIMGAVWANLLMKPIQLFFFHFYHKKLFASPSNKIKLYILPILYCLLVIAIELFLAINFIWLARILEIFIVIILVYWAYRNEIKLLIDNLKFKFSSSKI